MLGTVAVAACTQAASVWWTCSNVYAGNDTDKVSGIAYFLTTDMLSYSAAQALAGKGADALTAALDNVYSFSGSSGGFGTSKTAAIPNSTLGLDDGKTYMAYLMIFNTSSITGDSKFYLTEAKELGTMEGAEDISSVKWGSQSTASQAAGAWSSVKASDPEPPIDSPEPTSGLLMLIGAAGLALRRKRA